jgi:hypothetical protein
MCNLGVTQGQPQQIPTQLPPSSMAVNNASVPMSVVQIQLPQKTETVQQTLLPKIDRLFQLGQIIPMSF